MGAKELGGWRFAADRGGTFTDVIALSPGGAFHAEKLLSESPQYTDPTVEGIRRILARAGEGTTEALRIGTTVATNALLERKGARVLLIATEGFGDLLDIGHQARPEIFNLRISKPAPLYAELIEARERIAHDGSVERPLDAEDLANKVSALKGCFDTVAVVLMHSWRNPAHELKCLEVLESMGHSDVVLSHKSLPRIGSLRRGTAAVLDAYLAPRVRAYTGSISKSIGGAAPEIMQSSGMLALADDVMGKDLLLSGPAGGAVAVGAVFEQIRQELGLRGAIGFDMGGTSTDVTRYEDRHELMHTRTVAGLEFECDSLDIATVAAGGGSILGYSDGRATVGPHSAGAEPGPACYGLGGPPAITDANLYTGRLAPSLMPQVFGPARNSPPDYQASAIMIERLAAEMGMEPMRAALGFIRLANEKMASAVREISVSRGFDPREHALISFGGAGGQHACAVARLLGIGKIAIHPLGSLMSAYGIGLARRCRRLSQPLMLPFTLSSLPLIEDAFLRLDPSGLGARTIELRPLGAEGFIEVPFRAIEESIADFKARYAGLYGFSPGSAEVIEAVAIHVEIKDKEGAFPQYAAQDAAPARPEFRQTVYFDEGPLEARVLARAGMKTGQTVEGPALIYDEHTTALVEPGFSARLTKGGILLIEHLAAQATAPEAGEHADPVTLEIFNNAFSAIASDMGAALRNMAFSVNMKERMDFSCALFDAHGALVANAPHIPVHLGSMGDAVSCLIEDRKGAINPGDVYLTNNPYRGGSHLPDLTVVRPVFGARGELIFFTAARGHHADMGGTTPGSMPPSSTHISEEGVLIDNLLIVRDGVFLEAEVTRALGCGPYPARNLPERLTDLRAQIAACTRGAEELRRLVERCGIDMVKAYMRHIQDNAAMSVRRALMGLLDGRASFSGRFSSTMDDGTPIVAAITINAGAHPPETVTATVDFEGTGPEHPSDNLNAPLSVARSAVLYVLRALVDSDIPLNGGCLRPVEIKAPEGSIITPRHPAPVASGNVETSQRIVDVLLGALGVQAASQGTMNNLLFQIDGEQPYYETIAGGSGALKDFSGASATQVHMTNTRITDPEVLEFRHPGLRLREFSIRRGSGGRGAFSGGDGVIRRIEFLRPATVSLITERRVVAPFGLEGGGDGQRGVNMIIEPDGSSTTLPHRVTLRITPGQSIELRTPGGGAWGRRNAV